MPIDDITCDEDARRHEIRHSPRLNGIDEVEVEFKIKKSLEASLTVYLLHRGPPPERRPLVPGNVVIEGGRRGRRPLPKGEPEWVPDSGGPLAIRFMVDDPGDEATYTLRLVEADAQGHPTIEPLEGLDPHYASSTFRFRADAPDSRGCAPPPPCPGPEVTDVPEIDYLAKDYASFRRLLLDRISQTVPCWRERHVPDMGITLIEALAYLGDELSYYQDAVATEAYLGTARLRQSIRRHARLVDYAMHDGCNACAWLCLIVSASLNEYRADLRGLTFTTEPADPSRDARALRERADLVDSAEPDRAIFEAVTPEDGLAERTFHQSQNLISFYTWGDHDCCLPRGATRASLRGWRGPDDRQTFDQERQAAVAPDLYLNPGDVLIFEEVLGPETGEPADADPSRRHAVRLTEVSQHVDEMPARPVPVVEIAWDDADALPFPLCLTVGPRDTVVSVARGNVVLVDHGLTVDVGGGEELARDARGRPRSRPLARSPVTQTDPAPDRSSPASDCLTQNPRSALPAIRLIEADRPDDRRLWWYPRRDLLESEGGDRHVVLEVGDDGRAALRFGDGDAGRAGPEGLDLRAVYRVGNGLMGNVGADAITVVVGEEGVGFDGARNPLPATGGIDPESSEHVRLIAPTSARGDLLRAVTADDYATLAARDRRVLRAAADLLWTGSGYEARVVLDLAASVKPGDVARVCGDVARQLEPYRMIHQIVRVEPARTLPIDLTLTVRVQPHRSRDEVAAALRAALGPGVRSDGRPGFFHHDRMVFGHGIAVSELTAAASSVPGVISAQVTRLQVMFAPDEGEIEAGFLPVGRLEVARLDDDPSAPEFGRLTLILIGGR